jgi:hypothetical protein
MIKLKQLIKESLEDMVFSKTIKPRHKKRMKLKSTMFPSNPKLSMTPPSANDSDETRTEIFKLLAYNNGVIDKPMVKKYDDLVKPFMELIEKYNVDVTEDDLQKVIDEASKFTLKIKYKYNRPRPYQIADHYGIEDFKRHKLDSATTPSYPSGHALQGRLIGLILTDKDPKHQNEYMAVAQKISDSRIMARAHYPSDKEYGEKLADELYDQIIK